MWTGVFPAGGHFVCKTFDVFTRFSAGLLYILHRHFDRLSIFKPHTSRPANSERLSYPSLSELPYYVVVLVEP